MTRHRVTQIRFYHGVALLRPATLSRHREVSLSAHPFGIYTRSAGLIRIRQGRDLRRGGALRPTSAWNFDPPSAIETGPTSVTTPREIICGRTAARLAWELLRRHGT